MQKIEIVQKVESLTLAKAGLVREVGVRRCPMIAPYLLVAKGRRLYALSAIITRDSV